MSLLKRSSILPWLHLPETAIEPIFKGTSQPTTQFLHFHLKDFIGNAEVTEQGREVLATISD